MEYWMRTYSIQWECRTMKKNKSKHVEYHVQDAKPISVSPPPKFDTLTGIMGELIQAHEKHQ